MKKLNGKLKFISLFKPIMVDDIDIRDYYFNLFENLNGIKSKMNYSMNSIEITANEDSDMIVKYENDENGILILLVNSNGSFGMSNINAYLSDILQRLNGMSVIVTIDSKSINITNDPNENVFGVYYTRNNCCNIPDDKVNTICKIGKEDCCIFVSVGSNGFECLKFDTFSARMLLDRYSKNDLRATRIGNCKILGRKEMV